LGAFRYAIEIMGQNPERIGEPQRRTGIKQAARIQHQEYMESTVFIRHAERL